MATEAIAIQSDASVTTALAGDRMGGFEELYKKFDRRVYSVCLRMTGNVAEAEDLTQEVFIQLHRKLGSFRGEAAFTTWLHRLTVNQVLMHFRKRSVRSELTTEDGEMPDSVDPFTVNPETMPIITLFNRTTSRSSGSAFEPVERFGGILFTAEIIL